MDIFFTLAVWVVLVVLIAHGLRLTQLRRQEAEAPAPIALPASHPVTASEPARELVGAGER